jgi:hypothetical protein
MALDTGFYSIYGSLLNVKRLKGQSMQGNISWTREYYTCGRRRNTGTLLKTQLKEWKTPFETVWEK